MHVRRGPTVSGEKQTPRVISSDLVFNTTCVCSTSGFKLQCVWNSAVTIQQRLVLSCAEREWESERKKRGSSTEVLRAVSVKTNRTRADLKDWIFSPMPLFCCTCFHLWPQPVWVELLHYLFACVWNASAEQLWLLRPTWRAANPTCFLVTLVPIRVKCRSRGCSGDHSFAQLLLALKSSHTSAQRMWWLESPWRKVRRKRTACFIAIYIHCIFFLLFSCFCSTSWKRCGLNTHFLSHLSWFLKTTLIFRSL